jgi:flagellar biosynthesis/type III secretory pathway chaperone
MPYLSRLRTLENLLVSQFRTFQALYRLAQDEREALVKGDIPRLLFLAEHKEALLDKLAVLADVRRQLGLPVASGRSEGQIFSASDTDAMQRLQRLEEGARILALQVRDLAQGNRALASYALKQAADTQFYLLDDHRADLPALFAAIMAARDALSAHDLAAVSVALGDMQDALQQTGPSPDESQAKEVPHTPGTGAESPFPTAGPEAAQAHANLVEEMADLYRQEKAYRAVLRLSSRMLANAG